MVLLRVRHPHPLQPVPRALEGRGASVLRCSPRSHQDPDLREGGRWEEGQVKPDTGAAGAHPNAVLGSSSRGHRRPAGPCPVRVRGDTPPCPLPGGPGHNPRPAPQRPRPLQSCPGHPPKPCLLSAYAAQRERRWNETVDKKLEVLLGKRWEPQEPLGQMDASLFLPHVLREGGNPLSPPPLPSIPIAVSRVLPLCLQQHRLPVHPSRPIRRNREEKWIHIFVRLNARHQLPD